MEVNKTKRLLGMTIMLQCSAGATTAELAKTFGVEQRTIFRDIRMLREAGVPIESVPGRSGGMRLTGSALLDSKLVVDKDSFRQFLLCSVGSGQALDPLPELQGLLHESIQHLPKAQRDLLGCLTKRVVVDTRDWYWHPPDFRFLPELRAAVIESRKITADVAMRDGTILKNVELCPLGLIWKSGEWYLIVSGINGEIERHRVSRFKTMTVHLEQFDYPTNFSLKDWWFEELVSFGDGRITVDFTVHGSSVELFERLQIKSSSQRIRMGSGLRFILKMDSYAWLTPLLIAHADNIIIHKPVDLREAVVKWLKKALKGQQNSDKSRASHDISADLRLRASEKGINETR